MRCCREAAEELVSSLAPLCLPSPSVVWNEMIDGQKLWPALGHREALASVDLLNRYCNNRRCRGAAAEFGSPLALLC